MWEIAEHIKRDNDISFQTIWHILSVVLTILGLAVSYIRLVRKDYRVLDTNVILEKVLQVRRTLFSILLGVIGFLLWHVSHEQYRIIEIILIMACVCQLVIISIKAYRWIKEEKYQLRYDYLKNVKNPREMEAAWQSVWEVDNIEENREDEFFKIFAHIIDNLLSNSTNNIKPASELVRDLDSYFDNRRDSLTLYENGYFYEKIYKWDVENGIKNGERIIKQKGSGDEKTDRYKISKALHSILRKKDKKANDRARKLMSERGFNTIYT